MCREQCDRMLCLKWAWSHVICQKHAIWFPFSDPPLTQMLVGELILELNRHNLLHLPNNCGDSRGNLLQIGTIWCPSLLETWSWISRMYLGPFLHFFGSRGAWRRREGASQVLGYSWISYERQSNISPVLGLPGTNFIPSPVLVFEQKDSTSLSLLCFFSLPFLAGNFQFYALKWCHKLYSFYWYLISCANIERTRS